VACVSRDDGGYAADQSDVYVDDGVVSLANVVSDGLHYPASSYSADLASSYDHSPHSYIQQVH